MAVAGETIVLGPETAGIWLSRLITFSGWTVGAYLTTMLAWVFVPMIVLGWTPLVVVSGSMEPLIRAGDVVLIEQVSHVVGPGTVVAFDDGNGVVVHRVVDVSEDALYTTRGDANRDPDSTPVLQDQIIGQGHLLVPYIGLARVLGWVWWGALALLIAISVPLWRHRSGAATAVAVGLLVAAGAGAAVAVLSATTGTAASSVETLSVSSPTNLSATCGPPLGIGDVGVALAWTASPTTAATGYRIMYDAPGGGINFTEIAVLGPTATTFTHDIVGSLIALGTHTYAVQTLVGSWTSPNSNTDSVGITSLLGVYLCAEQ
jgi:signal peptidase I